MKLHAFDPIQARRSAGFTLIEIVVVLMIISIVIGMAAMITRGVTAAQKRSLTATRMAAVDAALIQFVAQQKRLPCPADGRLASTDGNAGLEIDRAAAGCDAVKAQRYGVLPWKTLGLSEVDATDGWDRRFTYRVWAALAGDVSTTGGMDMSMCDAASQNPPNDPATAVAVCNVNCTTALLNSTSCTPPRSFLVNKGLEVQNIAGVKVMDRGIPMPSPPTGAAYVLISHGETGGGGYLNTGVRSTSSVTDGDKEKLNYADLPLQPFYVDDSVMDASGAGHFDDVVSRPSILTVINKAGLAPRSH